MVQAARMTSSEFLEALPALFVGYPVALVGPREPAASHAELHAAPADVVQRGQLPSATRTGWASGSTFTATPTRSRS